MKQSKRIPRICQIDAGAIRSARESLQGRLRKEIINSVFMLSLRPVGHVYRCPERRQNGSLSS